MSRSFSASNRRHNRHVSQMIERRQQRQASNNYRMAVSRVVYVAGIIGENHQNAMSAAFTAALER